MKINSPLGFNNILSRYILLKCNNMHTELKIQSQQEAVLIVCLAKQNPTKHCLLKDKILLIDNMDFSSDFTLVHSCNHELE